MIINIDPHVHTEYSFDSEVPISQVINISRRKGLDGVAITDHNSIEGALKLEQNGSDGFIIIVGEEIKTSKGEITGLFLKEWVPPGLSPEETIKNIKSQGGLVCITHPFSRLRGSRLQFEALKRVIENVDIIERFNSRNIFQADNNRAYTFAKDNKKINDGWKRCSSGP
jgi:predicted metal-dependent phosphoesterase TrpH